MAIKYDLKLERQSVTITERESRKTYRLLVKAINPVNVDPEIFIWQREAVNPRGEPIDWFHSVVCALELNDIPNESTGPNRDGMYRSDTVDLLFFDLTLLEQCWSLLKQDRDTLLLELTELDMLSDREVV